mmetsp:Transcript_23805/g.75445  ORF Transcript_23805/g.75445 Transcript_23805/m.75445 type:complete len:260 (-) Transcript_23805:54-833(-)
MQFNAVGTIPMAIVKAAGLTKPSQKSAITGQSATMGLTNGNHLWRLSRSVIKEMPTTRGKKRKKSAAMSRYPMSSRALWLAGSLCKSAHRTSTMAGAGRAEISSSSSGESSFRTTVASRRWKKVTKALEQLSSSSPSIWAAYLARRASTSLSRRTTSASFSLCLFLCRASFSPSLSLMSGSRALASFTICTSCTTLWSNTKLSKYAARPATEFLSAGMPSTNTVVARRRGIRISESTRRGTNTLFVVRKMKYCVTAMTQ